MRKGIMKAWNNRKQILEGIKNRLFKKEHIERIANERLQICLKCPHVDKKGDKCYVKGTQPCCSICGCSQALKTRSLSSECADPENKRWSAVLTDEEQDKLYSELNYDPNKENL